MFLPANGGGVYIRRVSAMNWPTMCSLFGALFTAEELDEAWQELPIVRTSQKRGTPTTSKRHCGVPPAIGGKGGKAAKGKGKSAGRRQKGAGKW